MKKHLFNLVAVAILLTTVLAACKKDPKGGGGGGGGSYVIEAKNIIGDATDGISIVKALIVTDEGYDPEMGYYWNEYEAGAAQFYNNGFRINLCAIIPDEYLESAYDILEDEYLTLSDPNAKINILYIVAYNSENEEIGDFLMRDNDNDMYCDAGYMYADRNFTAKGSESYGDYTYACDCNFKRGWNLIYIYDDDYVEKITTQKPAGVNLQWHYWGLGCWNNSPKPAKQSKLFSRLGKTSY